MPDLMTRQEVADYLRVPLKTVEEWAYRGGNGPKFSKIGHHVRYRRADVDAWLIEKQRV